MNAVTDVYLWANGMVMCFDKGGAQVPELQGPLMDVREQVLAAANDATRFHIGAWAAGQITVARELWSRFRYDHIT